MKIREFATNIKPIVFLDMDGVLADFFSKYAEIAIVIEITNKYQCTNEQAHVKYKENPEYWQNLFGIRSYRDVPSAKNSPVIDLMVGTNFFAILPKCRNADALVNLTVKKFGGYNICSSPMRGDHANCEKNKRIWIQQNLNPPPQQILITSHKEKYAVQQDGTPNILVDDRRKNIIAWEEAGGIGIKYQADEDELSLVNQKYTQMLTEIQ